MNASYPFAAIVALMLLGGCASTNAVSELADKTAANVGTISVHLRRLDANSREIAERRATNVSRLHASNAELRAQYAYDVALTKKAGGGANIDLLDDIEEWRAEVDGIFEAAKGAEAARKEAVLETQMKLDIKSKTLAEIAQALAALAQDEKRRDRVRFLAGYALSLRTELSAALDQDTEAVKAAKALLKETGTTLGDGISDAKSRGKQTDRNDQEEN